MQDYQRLLVLNMLAYATQRNVDPKQLCRLAGIDLADLKQGGPVRLTPKQFTDLWLNAVHLSHDPLFGLHFGESLQLAALGIVGELIQNSRTIGEALTHAASFTALITDLTTMNISHTDQTFTVGFVPNADRRTAASPVFRQLMDLFMALVLHEVNGLVLAKITPQAVYMPIDGAHRREYERVLRCAALTSADTWSMVFDNRYWNEPVLTANYELQGLLLQKAGTMTNTLSTTGNFREHIGNFLLVNAYLGVPSLETVAANLSTSPRSLQRKLREEGVTYQQVADTVRKSLALHYLKAGRQPVKEIAHILGYNELSAFARAFKRWTGTTPVSYRQGLAPERVYQI
ncbi:MAG: AraC family transcriptional regulator [Bacteroidetes bacterium]|nr:AraC family transcriptional regulator [Fibrella sp.]